MFAIIRVRFNDTPASAVWSDAEMNTWLNPTIPYSLAEFWMRTSFSQADMRYFLFAPIAIDDPRTDLPEDADTRVPLVNGVTAEITRLFNPDWNVFDRLLIWFAQKTDLFGGGSFVLPVGGGQKMVPVAVCDILSPFSDICQEVGHAFGLNHELDSDNNEYQSPYSCMSSEGFGGATTSFERAEIPGFPKGAMPAPKASHVVTNDAQRIIGPYVTPVQIYHAAMGVFKDPASVYQVPDNYATAPVSFRINALDKGIDSWPLRQVVLAVLPPILKDGDTFFLELRRNSGYDIGLSTDGENGAPVAVVIHSVDATTGRVIYRNRIALVDSTGDRDYHCYAGNFTVRLNSFDDDFSSCNVTVGGGDFWKYFGVTFDKILNNVVDNGKGDWNSVDVSPCFMFAASPHQYRYQNFTTSLIFAASSFGYETPAYTWYLNDVLLKEDEHFIKTRLNVRVPVNGQLVLQEQDVLVNYTITQKTLKLTFHQDFSGISSLVKVAVNESSHGVIQSFYPERTVWTAVTANNVSVEWDKAYNDALEACEMRVKDINNKYAKSKSVFTHQPGPGPDWGINTVDVINELVVTNPAAANAVINEVSRMANVSRLEVLKRLR